MRRLQLRRRILCAAADQQAEPCDAKKSHRADPTDRAAAALDDSGQAESRVTQMQHHVHSLGCFHKEAFIFTVIQLDYLCEPAAGLLVRTMIDTLEAGLVQHLFDKLGRE